MHCALWYGWIPTPCLCRSSLHFIISPLVRLSLYVSVYLTVYHKCSSVIPPPFCPLLPNFKSSTVQSVLSQFSWLDENFFTHDEVRGPKIVHGARRAVELGLALIMLANGLLVLSYTSLTNNATVFYIVQVNVLAICRLVRRLVTIGLLGTAKYSTSKCSGLCKYCICSLYAFFPTVKAASESEHS